MTRDSSILVTGVAGFIGMHVTNALLRAGYRVLGIDDLNGYYSVGLKFDRLSEISRQFPGKQFRFFQASVEDESALSEIGSSHSINAVVHLAAQAGVRYSIESPMAYARSNLVGMTSILELARSVNAKHLVYASSSSVYGGNRKIPFSETDSVDEPASFYAATKRATEVMASSYASMFGLPSTGLRFFTVYGPWGRPDMAPWLFTDAILRDKPINIFGHGRPQRDYTYIDDVVMGVLRVLEMAPDHSAKAPHRILNIGNKQPVSVMRFIETLEKIIGKSAIRHYVDRQPGDVDITFADTEALTALTGYCPQMQLEEGLGRFVQWFRAYHQFEAASPGHQIAS
ncbi:MAG: NAD-dependent epimerase/dehydratase family protein [Burkholderiaceae bacterium]